MFHLAHSDVLRLAYGFPKRADLCGEGSRCIWKQVGPSGAPVALIRNSPEEACKRVGMVGLDRIQLVDELFSHAQYAAAYDLALFLASSPELFYKHISRPVQLEHAIGRISLLRMLAILAAIQGGLYHRARSSLLRVGQLLPSLDPDVERTRLMKGNHLLLWGRLAQVQSLPFRALQYFSEAKRQFRDSEAGVPEGMNLLTLRSRLHVGAASHHWRTATPEGREHHPTNLFGKLDSHYRHYLVARAEFERRNWDDALNSFEHARRELRIQAHAGFVDPIRLGYLDVGVARTLVGRGFRPFGSPRDLEKGLKGLLEARSLFRQQGFTPGEYVAHRHYCIAKKDASDEDTYLQLLRSLSLLAHVTGVLRFQLESDFQYAEALYKYGRPNAARATMKYVEPSEGDSFSDELMGTSLWKDVTFLLKRTERALDNAVEPLEPWGISDYAALERDFVESVSTSSALISAYGPTGSGRRIFLERVSEARQHGSDLAVVTGTARTMEEIRTELMDYLDAGTPVILYDLNEWHRDAQETTLRLLGDRLQCAGKVYATLTRPLADAQIGSQLAPGVAAHLASGAWPIDPLDTRREDTLLLARGFLVRTLCKNPAVRKDEARSLIFSGSAARYLKNRYLHIGDLYRAMRCLAHRLRMQYDVVYERDGYKKVPIETIERYLVTTVNASQKDPTRDQRPLQLGPEIKDADAITVQELARRFAGRLADVAKAAGIPRSTLIRAWAHRRMMDVWREAGGREATRSGPQPPQ